MTWFEKLLEVMSPQLVTILRDGLKELMQKLYEKALETDNKWDDIAVKMIAKVFDVELVEPE